MKNNRLFEENLLLQPKKEREEFFNYYTVSHPIMKVALEELKEEIYGGSQNIIMVVGPSGVGKSRLFNATIMSILNDMSAELEDDKSIIPVSGIELPNPDLGKFNWKDFYLRVLISLNEPLVDKKTMIDKAASSVSNVNKLNIPRTSNTAATLRRSVENAFYYRNTKAFLIDEAQHFFAINLDKRGESEKNQRQFNSIKSLANMGNTKIILFGTYNLNAVFNLDGQLSRRVKEIHFPRYDYLIEKDRKDFTSILLTFQKLLPVQKEPNLIKHVEYLYENSIGCTGILKNWLQRCLSDAIDKNEETITVENLKKNVLQKKKLLTLATEAVKGELDFKEDKGDEDKLKTILGINEPSTISKGSSLKGNSTPGVRNAQRDKVGF